MKNLMSTFLRSRRVDRERRLASLLVTVAMVTTWFGVFAPQHSAASTVLFTDGFESGALASWTVRTAGSGAAATQQTTVAQGAWAATMSAAGSGNAYLRASLPAGQSYLTATASAQIVTQGTNNSNVPLLRLFGASGSRLVSVQRQNGNTGKVSVQVGTTLVNTSARLDLGTWARVSVSVIVNGPASTVVVRQDGTVIFTTSAATIGEPVTSV